METLLHDPVFNQIPERDRALARKRILEEVSGRMIEEIELLDTLRAARANQNMFRLRLAGGVFDMVVYDKESDTCECNEIKHS